MEADTGAKRGASVEKEDAIGDATARYAMTSDVPLSAGGVSSATIVRRLLGSGHVGMPKLSRDDDVEGRSRSATRMASISVFKGIPKRKASERYLPGGRSAVWRWSWPFAGRSTEIGAADGRSGHNTLGGAE